MRFEQLIAIYGTIVVNAKNEEKADEKVNDFIAKLKDKHDHLISTGLIIGDIERL
ncbi:MAG: hypothetical protein ACE5K4_10970 [Candidatus Hydrothermarchaeota archaeon]